MPLSRLYSFHEAIGLAVIDGNMDIVRFLVQHNADINAQDNEGWTPLHTAVCCGNLNITKYLYEHNADLACVNIDKELPIDLAESDEIRKYLQEVMQLKNIDEKTARESEYDKMLEDCKSLIQSGCSLDTPQPKTGATLLHLAASRGYIKIIEMLLAAGANVNALDFEDWTPLHAAEHWGESEAARILLEHGATFEAIVEQPAVTKIPITPLPTERTKSSSIDCGKPSSSIIENTTNLRSPPASAPLVQSARLFWNSIENKGLKNGNGQNVQHQQNYPIVTTQLHQQQFLRFRQKFALGDNQSSVESSGNSTSSVASLTNNSRKQSPFAFVAGEQQKQQPLTNTTTTIISSSSLLPIFKRAESLKVPGSTFNNNNGVTGVYIDPSKPPLQQLQPQQQFMLWRQKTVTSKDLLKDPKERKFILQPRKPIKEGEELSNETRPLKTFTSKDLLKDPIERKNFSKTTKIILKPKKPIKELDDKPKPLIPLTATFTTNIPNAEGTTIKPSESSSSSSFADSRSLSPIVNTPFVTVRKQSLQQTTPPTQPTSQTESESERKAKSRLKLLTRRSTQGVTLEQLGEAAARHNGSHNNTNSNGNCNNHQTNSTIGECAKQANEKLNYFIENRKLRQQVEEAEKDCRQRPREDCNSVSNSSSDDSLNGDALKQVAEMKLKLQEMETEITVLEGAFGRSETQLKRFKTIAEQSEKESEELQKQNRQLKKELRDKDQALEECKETINHLQSRLEKMRNMFLVNCFSRFN
ncbi:hypothetical protein Mgra_00003896 [Meloidogyne graminicola]|uniref:ANK_REP_REGION domain-containing protein n=1 Tax=Meloidogyne graminicola TaxID=189291 RepID=A0A8S9ZT99_9BILA|nr:hypothetical protein Mgra_00003896 [Meloidogyne graminicola]